MPTRRIKAFINNTDTRKLSSVPSSCRVMMTNCESIFPSGARFCLTLLWESCRVQHPHGFQTHAAHNLDTLRTKFVERVLRRVVENNVVSVIEINQVR